MELFLIDHSVSVVHTLNNEIQYEYNDNERITTFWSIWSSEKEPRWYKADRKINQDIKRLILPNYSC